MSMRLPEDEIAGLFLALDAEIWSQLINAGKTSAEADELMKPIREKIITIIVALGIETKWVSLFLPQADEQTQIMALNNMYETFRNYLLESRKKKE